MKIKYKNYFRFTKKFIGHIVYHNNTIIGKITDVTKDYVYADVNLTEEEIKSLPSSFDIEIVKEDEKEVTK